MNFKIDETEEGWIKRGNKETHNQQHYARGVIIRYCNASFFMKPIAFGNTKKNYEVRYNIMIRILIQTLS